MKPLTPIGSPSPLRLLNKGPEYLRRQIDGGGHGRSISAVERLEADKAKYVKSQQVINTKQEPVLVPCATPPPQPRRGVSVPGSLTPHLPPRRSSTTPFSTQSGSVTSRDENDNEDSRKENRRTSVDIEAHNRSNVNHAMPPIPRTPGSNSLGLVAPHSAPVLRRSSGKRMLRPDSLVIYRQKKECKSPDGTTVGENNNMEVKGYSFVRRLFQGSMREKGSGGETRIQKMVISEEKASLREGDSRMSWTNDKDIIDGGPGSRRLSRTDQERIPGSLASSGYSCTLERTKNGFPADAKDGVNSGHINGNQSSNRQDENDPWKRASPQPAPRRKFVEFQRSKSELRLCCSMAVSEQEHFFDFCGLDMDMIERLGRENFLSGASSIDTLSLALRSVGGDGCGGSEPSEFSRHSGDGLFEEELAEQLPTGVSIIERNARVIKWLYGCKNAVQEGPKESTV